MTPPSFLTPAPARFIDPRGMRLGAGVSAVILLAGFLLNAPVISALVGLNLLVSAARGTRYFLPGRAWPLVKRTLRLGPTELEHEYPPRFAQAMGGVFLAAATVAFLLGSAFSGWLLTAAVGALQLLLATTGICIGCKLYFLRWFVPSLFARALGRAEHLPGFEVQPIRRVN